MRNGVVTVLLLAAVWANGSEPVRLGVDVLESVALQGESPLAGKRVGLITNHTGRNGQGETTIDVLNRLPGAQLTRLFSPEHGIRGELDQPQIDDDVDGPTGLPIVSLYGPRRAPEPEHLADLDVLAFDIQDIGCRFYTYISTMKNAMEVAAREGVAFLVLDRPNPIGGVAVEGPMLDAGGESFVGCHALPVRHGMTIAEVAQLLVADGVAEGLELMIVRCEGWRRGMTWDATGLVWTNPSPNMRRLTQALLYPGVGLLETTNLSVGRGTDTPFELFGAPWIEPRELAAELNAAPTPGVRFVPRYFTPNASKFTGERCGGVDLLVVDAKRLNAVELGLTIAVTLRRLYPEEWETERYPRLLISTPVYEALLSGASPTKLHQLARAEMDAFMARREAALLYEP